MLSESEEESIFGVCFMKVPAVDKVLGSPYSSELQSMLDAVKPQGYSLNQQVLHKISKLRSLLLFRL